MYAVILCPECSRYRMIDSSSTSTECPYCGKKLVTKDARILFEDRDQDLVRAALSQATGFVPEKEKKAVVDRDPLSTLAFRYEHCSDACAKTMLLAEGLTEILGTFTLEDVESIEPRYGERLIENMVDGCLVTEVSPGRYRGI